MKHLKLFFALFAMLALGVGNAWGAEATVYTSNVELSTTGGTKATASKAKISNVEYSAMKLGSSGKAGNFYVNLPANTTSLTLHAAAWNGKNSNKLTLSSETAGVTISPSTEQTLTANSGVSGNSTTYTITPNNTKEFFTFTLTGATSGAKIKLACTERCLIWGVNAETAGGGETPGEGGGEDPETPGAGGSGSIVIKYNSTFTPTLPSAKASVNTSSTAHTVEGLNIHEQGIYKGSSNNYLMFVENKGFLYNTQSLGTITSVSVTYTSGTSTSGKAGVYFGATEQSTYTTTSNTTIKGQSKTDTWTNTTEGNGFFQLSTSSKNVQITQIEITYTSGSEGGGSTETVPSVTLTPDVKDFGTVNVGETPSQEFTITTENTTAALTASLDDDTNYAVSAVAGNKVTVTYQPQSAGTHPAVLTVKAGEEATATVNLTGKAVQALEGTWILITDASSLKAGDEIIIASKDENYALSMTQNGNNRGQVEITKTDNTITATTEAQVLTLQTGTKEGTLALSTGDGYLYAASTSKNYLRTETTLSDNSSWKVTIAADGTATLIAQGENTKNTLYYNKSSKIFSCYDTEQQPIAIYKKVDPNAVVEPVFTPAAGEYYGTQSVTLSCATAGAEVYYTLDGIDPTSASTKYTGAISIASTTTIKAVAIKGENSSAVVSATYTILAPLATMQAIFDKATAVGGTATPVHITMNNWVVTGVKNNNVYVTDGTKGLIIYTASHGFNVGDILSGTVACKVQLYYGSSELTELTSTTEGLTVTTGGVVTPVVVNDVTTLGGVNTGSVVKITGVCETKNINSRDYFYVGGVQLYNSLFAYENPTVGSKYNVTGVYVQYNDVPEVLPRSAADIEEIIDLPTATIAIADMTMEIGESKTIEATITPDAAKTTVQYAITAGNEYITLNGTTITAVAAGEATITATIAEVVGEYYGATKTFKVTVKPQNIAVLPFEFTGGKADIENTLGMSQDGLGSDYNVTTKLKFDGTDDWVIIHFNGQAGKLAYDIKGNGFSGGKFTVQESADGSTYTEVVAYIELGDAATKEHELAAESRYVKFIYTTKSSGNVGLGDIKITKFGETPVDPEVPEVPEEPTLSAAVYQKVTSAPADWSGEYILVYEQEDVTDCYVWNGKDENNGYIVATRNNDIISGAFATITIAPMTDGYSVRVNGGDKSGLYIGGVSGSNTISYSAEAILNTIEFSEVGIDLTSNTSVMRFNAASNTLRFRYYKSGQSAVQLYKKLVYTREVTSGNFGTICLPYGSTEYSGATFFAIAYQELGKVYIDEVTTLVAGVPYIFQAKSSKLSVTYEGTPDVAKSNNGLHGTFTEIADVAAHTSNKGYILTNNLIRSCLANCNVPANRAYIVLDEISTEQTPAPVNRRRVGMNVEGENVETGVEDLFTTEALVKVIENGQLIIIRDGVKYNVQGQKL